MSSQSGPPEQLVVPARPECLAAVRALVDRHASAVGFDEHARGQIVLAIDEALTNVIRHGYGGACDRPIEITLARLDGSSDGPGLEVVIRDEGRQVDPATIKSRSLDDIRPGGLGVHIISTVMDDTQYTRRPGPGMQLRVRKYVLSPKTASTVRRQGGTA